VVYAGIRTWEVGHALGQITHSVSPGVQRSSSFQKAVGASVGALQRGFHADGVGSYFVHTFLGNRQNHQVDTPGKYKASRLNCVGNRNDVLAGLAATAPGMANCVDTVAQLESGGHEMGRGGTDVTFSQQSDGNWSPAVSIGGDYCGLGGC
jgi:hypothetical protein